VLIPTYPGAEDELERQREARRNRKDADAPRRIETPSLIQGVDLRRTTGIQNIFEDEPDKEDTQEFLVLKSENLPQPDVNFPALNQKREVLLIEDNKDTIDQYRRVLQAEGFDVQTADHPSYAEAMVGQLRPNVVVLDGNFAEGRGWELLENLRKRDDSADIPVVFTAIGDESERAAQLGAYAFMQRPLLADDLIRAVLAAEQESKRERIVIIDDQPDALRLLSQLLGERADYRVYAAQTGEEGISLIARRRPDLVILDLRMPDKDGFAVLDELRGNPETTRIPVLVVTGDADLSASEREQLNAIPVLPKAEISQESIEFIENVRSYLQSAGRK
jgi:CheY-like chemotaxis protein